MGGWVHIWWHTHSADQFDIIKVITLNLFIRNTILAVLLPWVKFDIWSRCVSNPDSILQHCWRRAMQVWKTTFSKDPSSLNRNQKLLLKFNTLEEMGYRIQKEIISIWSHKYLKWQECFQQLNIWLGRTQRWGGSIQIVLCKIFKLYFAKMPKNELTSFRTRWASQ